jgi:RNA-dependent RNA polymerase
MNGPRSHPAEMSGGDLDGDTFWVSCEQKFLFEENEEPFDYHDQATEDAERMELNTDTTYEISDVCNFFVQYIEADK